MPDLEVTPEPLALRIWLPDTIVLDNPEAMMVLEGTISEFEERYGATVEIIVKPKSGTGGLYDSLLKTKDAAPAVLPDLMALPYDDAFQAGTKGLLQPLDDLLPTQISEDLYPFAQNLARVEESWLTLPFVADIEHLAFRTSALSEPPVNWSVVMESNASYVFPAGGPEAVLPDALLLHYLSAVEEGSDPIRNEQAVRQTLAFYEAAYTQDIVDEATIQASRPHETWERALQGEVAMAHTTAHLWLNDQEQAATLHYGPVPTADSSPRYIADGLAYVVISGDPAKQEVLARLLEALMEPEMLATWSQSERGLPSRRAALALWPASAYTAFANEALEIADLRPQLVEDLDFVRSLHRAVLDVLSGKADAATAAQTAIETW